MYTASKYMGQNLVKSETLPNIAMPKNRYHANTSTYETSYEACPCCASTSRSRGSLARLGGASLFFISYTQPCVQQCQRTTQVVSGYKGPIPPYSLRNRPILCIVPFGRRISLRHGLRRVRKPILSRSVAALLSGCVWSHLVSMTNAIRSLLWAAPLWSCERQKSRVSRWSGSRSAYVNPATFNHTTL